MQEAKKLNILCFGDSLTKGHIRTENYDTDYKPYGDFMKNYFQDKGITEFEVIINGVDGSQAVKMQNRLKEQLEEYQGKQFKLAFILAGTNDLGSGVPQKMALDSIIKLHQTCHELNIRTVAITIPQFQNIEKYPQYISSRQFVNNKLKEFSEKSNQMCFWYDLYNEIPYDTNTGFWSDNLHFSELGYKQLGEKLAQFAIDNKIIDLIKQ